jgi:two-component system sensor histidine kinase/response regulator
MKNKAESQELQKSFCCLPTNAMILLVDDIPENIQILGKILKKKGYSFTVATNGEETLATLAHQNPLPDLILLDIMLPDIDGFEICKRLKTNEKTCEIPIIFLTAKTELSDKINGFDIGAVDYITKPFEAVEVIARVQTHIQLKQSKDVIRKYSKDLEKAIATRDKLFSIIGHDLRGPISSVSSLLKLLKEGEIEKETEEDFFRLAIQSVNGTIDLLDNLLYWAKSHQEKIDYNPEFIDIKDIIHDHIAFLQGMADEKRILLKVRIGTSPFTKAFADRNMIAMVMRNLITNAIKFTPEFGEITISFANNAEKNEITITDTGIGIGKEDMDKLFRIDRSIVRRGTNNEKGTGLGLLLCKEFIQKNGGDIWVESEIGKGSSFKFTLPNTG